MGTADAVTRVYRKGALVEQGFPISDVSEHLKKDDCVVWVDLCGPSKEDLDQLGKELGLHELAIEDALTPHERPKLDRYMTHRFLACAAVRLDPEKGVLEEFEIDAFINERYLITVRKEEGFSMEPVVQRWDRSPDLAAHGVSFMLYGLLDVVVDSYFDAVEEFDEYYDEVSAGVFADRPLGRDQQLRWFGMRRAMVRFHRLVVPMREAVSSLMRREHALVSEDLYAYFQDVYDHILRVSESSDSLRDLVSTIVETNISLRDYRQNQVVKQVSSWAAIIAVPALITGYYGMNVPFPGYGQEWGFISSVVVLALGSVTLYILFRRIDWI